MIPPDNQRNKPLYLIGLTILFLIALSYLPSNIIIFGYSVKPVDLFMDVKPDSLLDINNISHSNFLTNQKSSYEQVSMDNREAAGFNRHEYTASISLNLINDVLRKFDDPDKKNTSYNSQITIDEIGNSNEKLGGDLSQMKYFFEALKNTKVRKVRVAHFGDSEIEGDLITSNIRQELQQKFGGEGAGFLSITSQDITFRTTTKQSFSNDWDSYSILEGSTGGVDPGMNGFVAIPKSDSWVEYQATNFLSSVKSFNTVCLFYNDAKSSSIKYSFDNGSEKSTHLQPGSAVQELILKAPGDVTSVKISATMQKQAHFFGASLESGNGIYVDNYPLRGNSGVSLGDIPKNILKGFDKYMNYKLIILSFGLNVITYGSNDFKWYEKQMVKVVNHLKSTFPNTSIIIVGVGDKSMKRGSRFITNPNVPRLIQAQENIALRTGVSFWNLFEAMGGKNSMNDWVNANPPLAFKDYTHVTLQGAQKIAKMLTGAILEAYNNSK